MVKGVLEGESWASTILNRYIAPSKMQLFFSLLFILTLPFTGMFLRNYSSIVSHLRRQRPDYPWPEYKDLWISVYSCAFLIVMNILLKKFLFQLSESLLKSKYKGQERENRRNRMIDCFIKLFYFCFSSVTGYLVAKDADFMPVALGGHGSSENIHIDFPYQSFDKLPFLKEFIMLQLGYHLHSLIMHVSKPPRNDFMEMLLHHMISVFLIVLAYFMNYHVYSILVLIIHDPPDIFTNVCKILVDTKYVATTLVFYFMMLLSWGYLRLYVFPVHVIWNAYYRNPIFEEIYGARLLCSMLHILLVLDAYWFYLFLQMGYNFFTTKQAEDMQQKLD